MPESAIPTYITSLVRHFEGCSPRRDYHAQPMEG
jgi:hypothetical protein